VHLFSVTSSISTVTYKINFHLGCLHPVGCKRSGVWGFRLRNDISIVFTIYFLAATCFGRTTIFRWKYIWNENEMDWQRIWRVNLFSTPYYRSWYVHNTIYTVYPILNSGINHLIFNIISFISFHLGIRWNRLSFACMHFVILER
jgi:hypothetical protein